MMGLHRLQGQACFRTARLQPAQAVTDHHHAARGQAPRHGHMLQVPQHRGVARGWGSAHAAGALNILDMAALASSPMRMRKSVPISAA